jgi:hypothetical protein
VDELWGWDLQMLGSEGLEVGDTEESQEVLGTNYTVERGGGSGVERWVRAFLKRVMVTSH